jgi:hypothetical protein
VFRPARTGTDKAPAAYHAAARSLSGADRNQN